MGEYRLAGGGILTDKDIDRMCERFERGEYDGPDFGEPVCATVAFTDDDGSTVEGVVCGLSEDGLHVDVRDAPGTVHEGIPCKGLSIVRSVWDRIG